MATRVIGWLLLVALGAGAAIIQEVRAAIARNDLQAASKLIAEYRAAQGVTPEMLEALSWLARGALAAKRYAEADEHAAETRRLALEMLKGRKLDDERHLAVALGAAIEVHAQVVATQSERGEALRFLEQELAAWRNTSIRTRIQKNINLLSLAGKPAPRLELDAWLGPKPPAQAEWKERVVLLFFWAHWCPDCKAQVPALARLQAEYGSRGLLLIAPTQRYGYVARGKEAAPDEERAYIEQVRREAYGALRDVPVPLSEENFKTYGASTTPTLVLVDRQGLVRLYHPGEISYEELAPKVAELLSGTTH